MKKSILNLGNALTREEQKKVFGGNLSASSGGTCNACREPFVIEDAGPNDMVTGGCMSGVYNVSREDAQAFVSGGGYWCCDSCSTASWMGIT